MMKSTEGVVGQPIQADTGEELLDEAGPTARGRGDEKRQHVRSLFATGRFVVLLVYAATAFAVESGSFHNHLAVVLAAALLRLGIVDAVVALEISLFAVGKVFDVIRGIEHGSSVIGVTSQGPSHDGTAAGANDDA